MNKYGTFDLGFGLHIALDPDHYDALIPNVFVTQTSLGKLEPPKSNLHWDLRWAYICKLGQDLVNGLNSGKLTPEFVSQEIERINADTLKGTLTI